MDYIIHPCTYVFCPRFGNWKFLQAVLLILLMYHCDSFPPHPKHFLTFRLKIFEGSLVYLTCASPGISHFSKEPWLL